MSNDRYRLRYCFWLEIEKPEHAAIADEIELLKNERAFAPAVRDGIRLIADLRRGSFDVLIELFPDIRHHIVEPGQGDNDGGNGDDIKAIRQQLARLEQATLQQSAPSELLMTARSGPKPMTIPALKAPVFDDDDDGLLNISRDTSTASADNFLKAAFALQG